VKNVVKKWAKSSYVPPSQEKEHKLAVLEAIHHSMEVEEVIEQLINQEKSTSQEVHTAYRKEEEHWRLKSRSLWLKYGIRIQPSSIRKLRPGSNII
jgi:hypothetical protein